MKPTIRRARAAAAFVTLSLLLAGCSGGGPAPHLAASTSPAAAPTPTEVSIDCTDSDPCTLPPGTYDTGTNPMGFHPGMTLTLPTTWGSHSLDKYEFSLYPADHQDDRLFFWEDMVAVKSSGPGHGTTILKNVGTSPKAMMAWITGNPDFHIIAPPTTVTSVGGIKATRVVLVISHTARFGDRRCPTNPRCAALFTRRDGGEYYASVVARRSAWTSRPSRSTGVRTHSSSCSMPTIARSCSSSPDWRNPSSTACACTQESPRADPN